MVNADFDEMIQRVVENLSNKFSWTKLFLEK